MGAVAAELQSLGHRPNFFYLQHAMGLASSMGLGIALSRPELTVVVFDGDGSILMNLGGLTTLARYRPTNLVHVVFDNESLLSVGGFPTATSTGSDIAGMAAAAGVPRTRDRARHRLVRRRVRSRARGERPHDARRQGRGGRPVGICDRPVAAGEPISVRALPEIAIVAGESIMSLLVQLADALNAGSVKVVDLTQPLGPDTPVIGLPPHVRRRRRA